MSDYAFDGDTYFNGLNLSKLGTVSEPEIQYANFTASTSSPAGYDGAVLSNFKRDQTVIRFNLALTGTERERVDKLEELMVALSAGKSWLILPEQAHIGTGFVAVPNMALAPSRYIDGFVVPMEFIVPEGCARKRNDIVQVIASGSRQATTLVEPTEVQITGQVDAVWRLSFETQKSVFPGETLKLETEVQFSRDSDMSNPYSLVIVDNDYSSAYDIAFVNINSENRNVDWTYYPVDTSEDEEFSITKVPTFNSRWPVLSPGMWYIRVLGGRSAQMEWVERYIW